MKFVWKVVKCRDCRKTIRSYEKVWVKAGTKLSGLHQSCYKD